MRWPLEMVDELGDGVGNDLSGIFLAYGVDATLSRISLTLTVPRTRIKLAMNRKTEVNTILRIQTGASRKYGGKQKQRL